LILFLLQTDK